MLTMRSEPTWEKPSIELPSGWHAAMQKMAEMAGGVPLKYVYVVAIDQFLSTANVEAIEDAAWTMHRRTRKDLRQVASLHSPDDVEKRVKAPRRR